MPSTLALCQLCMLFRSTHEERQSAEVSAEPGERIVKSPLQRTLTAQSMGRWAKHNGALEHIGVTPSVEMIELQRAQRFRACPANPDTSVFAEFSMPLSLLPPNQMCLRRRKGRCKSTRTLSLFCETFQRKGFYLLPVGRLAGFFLQEIQGAYSHDACLRSGPHVVFLQDEY